MSRHIFAKLVAPTLLLLLTSCATQNADRDAAPPWRTKPLDSTTGIFGPGSPGYGTDKGDASGSGDKARVFKGTGQLVKGQLPGGGLPARDSGCGRQRAVGRAQLRGGRSPRCRPQHPDGHAQRVVHDRAAGGRHGHYSHDFRHSTRGASGHPRNAAAHERRRDGQGKRHLEDRAGRRRRARQRDASARQFHTRAAARVQRADRAVALHECAPDGHGTRTVPEGSHVSARR